MDLLLRLHSLLARLGQVTVFPALEQRATLPVWYLPCFVFVVLLSIAAPRGLLRTAFSLPVVAFMAWKYGQYTFGANFPDRYPWACFFITVLFKYVDFVLLGNADREKIRPKFGSPATGIGSPPPPLSTFPRTFRQRFLWAFKLVMVYHRGVGWTHEVKGVPPHSKPYSRWNFVAQQISLACLSTLIIKAGKAYVSSSRFGNSDPLARSYFFSEPLWYQLSMSFCTLCLICAPFILLASTAYSVGVALGIWRPEDCPPIWGSWSDSYTVRKLWGTVWHQCLRRITNTSGSFVAKDVLRLKKGTFASKYTQLFVGFFASAIIHCGGAIYTCGHDTGDMKYFMAQPVAILIEDHVIEAGRRLGFKERPVWKRVGYVWTAAWLLYSMRWNCGPQLEEGYALFPKTGDFLGFFNIQTGQATA
ncbi:membrane bound O-acyl transferase family-domain-containing protein [Phyllosticta citribraziliensis]|uniref:Membrane bound O-acyl transferase family-domain-containing protein n=1 Tax=Phyllosticta citribraziliensis TaxID=989973 RepID=A0ABR1LJN9_9PEZI